MTGKQAQEKIAQACEDATAEVTMERWANAHKILRDAADTARAMTITPVKVTSTTAGVAGLDGPRYSTSLERGLRILGLFTPDAPLWGISEVADELDMSRSTTHRYMITLVALGQLEQTSQRRYRLVLLEGDEA